MECNDKIRQYLIIAAVILCLVNALVLAAFPAASSITVWKGYTVLSVSPSDREREILDILDNKGLDEYVTESNSLDLKINELAPVQPFLASARAQRSRWFRDPESDTRFLYLADVKNSDKKILDALSSKGFTSRLEKGDELLWFPVMLVASLAVLGIVLVHNRLTVLIAALPIIAYSLSANRIGGFFSAVLALCTSILLADILDPGRFLLSGRQILRRILGNPLYLVPAAVALVVSFVDSLHLGILFVSCCILTVSSCFLWMTFRIALANRLSRRRLHPRFTPLPMNPGSLYRKRFFNKPLSMTVASFALFLLSTGGFLFVYHGRRESTENRVLSIPAPSGYTESSGFSIESYQELMSMKTGDELPDLGDFIALKWNMTMYPWKSVREETTPPVPGEVVAVQDFIADENGVLESTTRKIGEFNEAFVRNALHSELTPLERMLVRQGRFITARYTRHDQ